MQWLVDNKFITPFSLKNGTLKPILLGLEYYELYNKLDNHQDKLIDGIVTNSSLYITK